MSSFQTGSLNPAAYLRGTWVETIRRRGEGQWLARDGDPDDVINLTVKLKIFWPMQRIMKRLQNGPEDGIYIYGAGILNLLPSSKE
jgi:hypothetical protein